MVNTPERRIKPASWLSPADYVRLFEDRVARIHKGSNSRNISLSLQGTTVVPEKAAPAILWKRPESYECLLKQEDVWRCFQEDHSSITNEFGLDYHAYHTVAVGGFLVVVPSGLYLLVDEATSILTEDIRAMERFLERYPIEGVLSVGALYIRKGNYIASDEKELLISLKTMDQLLFNNCTEQIERTYGLTITERLWFRHTHELPKGRKPLWRD